MLSSRMVLGTVALLSLLLLVAACKPSEKTVEITPFIGGTEGLAIEFTSDQRKEVFDSGEDPFDVVVKLENKGEHLVTKGKATVSIAGILPQSFGKTEDDLRQNVNDDLIEKRRDPVGNILPGPPVFVEFIELNHISPIVGTTLQFPLRASVCYDYKSDVVSKICVRENILSPAPDGLCLVEESKTASSSGAPVHVTRFIESARGKDKVSFTFDIKHVGTGLVFEPGSNCEGTRQKDNVFVKVDTRIDGLSCTGLPDRSGTAVQGKVRLIESSKTTVCTQTIKRPADYETPVYIEITYDYESSETMSLKVKHTPGVESGASSGE